LSTWPIQKLYSLRFLSISAGRLHLAPLLPPTHWK
jgi:hypothetical protein